MLLLGCKPPGRNTEQHDTFFGVAENIADLKQDIINFWPEANGKIHIDTWREITVVDNWTVEVVSRNGKKELNSNKLFFLNLGGYKPGDFEEYHYKMLIVSADKASAIQSAKQSAFYRHTGFEGANSHIDDKYGVDVDDVYEIEDILPPFVKEKYELIISPAHASVPDTFNIGYIKLEKL